MTLTPEEEAITDSFKKVTEIMVKADSGDLSDEPRTINLAFPGSRDRAMGHARVVCEDFEKCGIDARPIYDEPLENYDQHRINIEVEGGSLTEGSVEDGGSGET